MKNILWIALIITLLPCCKKELPVPYGSIQGTIVNGFSQEAESNILVYLLNSSLAIDTLNIDFDKHIVDSTSTDSEGYYLFDSLTQGDYTLAPYSAGESVKHIDTTDNYELTILGNDNYTVGFEITPIVMSTFFTTEITFINPPQKSSETFIKFNYYRREWITFVPKLYYVSDYLVIPTLNYEYKLTFLSSYGYSFAFYTLDNYFWITAQLYKDNAVDLLGEYDFWIGTPLAATPENVKYEFDLSTQTLENVTDR